MFHVFISVTWVCQTGIFLAIMPKASVSNLSRMLVFAQTMLCTAYFVAVWLRPEMFPS